MSPGARWAVELRSCDQGPRGCGQPPKDRRRRKVHAIDFFLPAALNSTESHILSTGCLSACQRMLLYVMPGLDASTLDLWSSHVNPLDFGFREGCAEASTQVTSWPRRKSSGMGWCGNEGQSARRRGKKRRPTRRGI